jgi:hypothetical protein
MAEIFATLAAAPAVAAIAGDRIYPLRLPEGMTAPAVTWQGIGGGVYTDLDGDSYDGQRVQFTCWAPTLAQAKELAKAVRPALKVLGVCVSYNGESYEDDTKRFGVSFDFVFWEFDT